jgi:hypothetical protein
MNFPLARILSTDALHLRATEARDSINTLATWLFSKRRSPDIDQAAARGCYTYRLNELRAVTAELAARGIK